MSYNYEEAQDENAVALLVYAADAMLVGSGFEDMVTISATGGQEGQSDNIRSFGLHVTVKNTELNIDDEQLVEALDFILSSVVYDFAVHQRWIIHLTIEMTKESTAINPDSKWAV